MGSLFLEEFLKRVLSVEAPPKIPQIEVCREKGFKSNINNNEKGGFIDIYIETEHCAYPVEVKINAGDQSSQIKRYYDFARVGRGKETTVYYLTLDGHSPCQDSTRDVPDEKIKRITFREEILDWLLKCEEISLSKRSPNVAGAIRQYITLIEKLSENRKDIYMEAIQELILSSKDSYLQACAIEQNMSQARTKMVFKVFSDLNKYITSHPLVCNKLSTINEIDDLETFYNESNTWPKICVDITPPNLGKTKLYLTIEIENSLYYGILFTDDSFNRETRAPKTLLKAFACEAWQQRINNHPGKNWWIWWRLLHPRFPLNFRTFDGGYEELYDEDSYKTIMAEMFKEIDENLKSIIKTGLPADLKNLEY